MICMSCGTENIEGAAFCSNCGAPLTAAPEPETAPGPEAALEPEVTPEPEAAPEPETAPVPEAVPEPEAKPEPEAAPGPEVMPETETAPVPADRGPRMSHGRMVLLAVLAAVAVVAVAAAVVLSSAPPALSDEEALAMLPAQAEILGRHEEGRGRLQVLEYRYPEAHTYCDVERTERAAFRYAKGAWTAQDGPEVLDETEDWTALAGTWTEQTAGPGARYLQLEITDFSGGAVSGELCYTDTVSSCEGPAESFFAAGVRPEGATAYVLEGTGYFRYSYLRVDRDEGVFFGNDSIPMDKTGRPAGQPVLQTGRHDWAQEEETPEGTWLIAVAEVNVRSSPDTDSEPLGVDALGTVLAGTGEADGWYQVEYGDTAGYVAGGLVRPVPEDGAAGVVTASTELNVRTGPDTDHDRLGTVDEGTRMVYIGETDGWYQVVYEGDEGYVSGEYATAVPAEIP